LRDYLVAVVQSEVLKADIEVVRAAKLIRFSSMLAIDYFDAVLLMTSSRP